MQNESTLPRDSACWILAAVFVSGLLLLALRLKNVQIDSAADYGYAADRQSVRRVQTDGIRGRILDRRHVPLAENRRAYSIVCDVARFQKRSWSATAQTVLEAIHALEDTLNVKSPLDERAVLRHVRTSLAMPLVVCRDIGFETLARFSEHERDFPGFACREHEERSYPLENLAAHAIGYVGRDRAADAAGDEKFDFRLPEMRGRAGLELYYDDYLRGVPGERRIVVDARGFAIRESVVAEPQRGPDLILTLDARIQRAVEHELVNACGACVVLDPRSGDVLAFASAPDYDLNAFVPTLTPALYARFSENPAKPLLNRASGGTYAPGSTFKPVTSLAALAHGFAADRAYDCTGCYELGAMRIHCASRWGHGALDMSHALMKSCNPYFCSLGVELGVERLVAAARAFGLGARTGLDLGVDAAGVVPEPEWKRTRFGEPWYTGDLAQMAMGQGMLLVTPLQMACVIGAIGTGYAVTPHFKGGVPAVRRPLPFAASALAEVRRGLRLVVTGDDSGHGTGRLGGEDVAVPVCGKTGTAEVGSQATRRKNTWFVAYAPADNPSLAIAMVIENGQSGGGTTAPKVAAVLRTVFGSAEKGCGS